MAIVFKVLFVVAVAVVTSAYPSPGQLSGDGFGVDINTHDPTEFLNFEADTFPLTGVVLDDFNRERRSYSGYGSSSNYGQRNYASYGRSYGNYAGPGYGGGYSGGRRLVL